MSDFASSVNVPSPSENRWEILPPVVYVPCVLDERNEAHLALREMPDGRRALLVYTALDRLIDMAGEQTPWVLMDWAMLEEAQQVDGFDMIVKDIVIPEERR
ncbi:SAV_915 family protein [Schaalia sp. Marseille-Q2122]|uniref:SAV_915 family protein n=1 Tax=Schaalia sp. Marseille-Q2122 TaxID=2736604 RepID=UPI001588C730|nr:SAV_915 family protein [Schaalia sp. Marseille-Q2122]